MRSWLADFRQDFRRGSKLLRKNPSFTLTAVLTLALGIGATTAIFSVLHTVVLRPLPFPDPDRLVWVLEVHQRDGRIRPPTVEVHEAWREQSRTLTRVGAGITGGVDVSVSGPAGATRISLGGIALNTLSVLGVEPILGRWYLPDEVTVEGDTAESLVISYGLWQSHLGGDPDVLGKTIPGWDAAWGRIIIGVMPPDFWVHPSMADVQGWFAFNVGRIPGARAQTVARLAPGVEYAQAEAELSTIASGINASLPAGADAEDWRVRLEPLHDIYTAGYRQTLYLLLGAVAFVLLIATVNVANLQLSRSVTRQSEMATRMALGAGRGRLIRQLLAENVLLALVGGGLGIVVAYLGIWVFVTLAPGFYPPTEDITIRPAVLLFTLGVSVLAGIVAGLVPALRISGPDLQDALGQVIEVRVNQGNASLADDSPREIVGIVSDTRMRLRDDPMPIIYVPYQQHLWDYGGTGAFNIHARKDFVMRTATADPMDLARSVRQVVADVDAAVAVDNIVPMRQRLSESAANERFWLRLLGLFAALAVFLAIVGIYGVISYAVEQRAHEFGIRTALGAGREDIIRLVLREGLIVTLTGLVLGVGGAFAVTRLIASQLYGVTAMDPLTIATVALLLTAVAMLACVIPARHAARVDPVRALRTD